jgi:hypothetical protein
MENPIHPELLNIGPNYGQNFGFTIYRTTIPKSKHLSSPSGLIFFLYISFEFSQFKRMAKK